MKMDALTSRELKSQAFKLANDLALTRSDAEAVGRTQEALQLQELEALADTIRRRLFEMQK